MVQLEDSTSYVYLGSASTATVDIWEIIKRLLVFVQATLNAIDQLSSVRAISIVKS